MSYVIESIEKKEKDCVISVHKDLSKYDLAAKYNIQNMTEELNDLKEGLKHLNKACNSKTDKYIFYFFIIKIFFFSF